MDREVSTEQTLIGLKKKDGVSEEEVGEFGLQWSDRRVWDGQQKCGREGEWHLPGPFLLLKGFVSPEWAELTLS